MAVAVGSKFHNHSIAFVYLVVGLVWRHKSAIKELKPFRCSNLLLSVMFSILVIQNPRLPLSVKSELSPTLSESVVLVRDRVRAAFPPRRKEYYQRSIASSNSWRGRDRKKEKVRSDKSPKKGSESFQGGKEITITPSLSAP
ncbi:hypothetical protein CR513_01011, partial [Mucuna pruriens]